MISTTPPLAVLFEDAHVLAVAKPAGMLTQGYRGGEPTLEDATRRYLDPAGTGSVYLGTVHRLDRPVSGVVLWAKHEKAARRLSSQFAGRETVKEYLAIVDLEQDAKVIETGVDVVWEDWLADTTDSSGVVRVVGVDSPRSRLAVTRLRLEKAPETVPEGTAWLRLWPVTGRTHQLRAQAGSRGMPVRGDAPYGSSRPFSSGIALHAHSITFQHPTLKRFTTVVAPCPWTWGLSE